MNARTEARILLVEDTVSLARVYVSYLRDDPYEVVHVETGTAALDHLAANQPDVILLDLRLPDMDGFDILKHVGTHEIPCAVIVITAHGSIATAVEAMRLGAADFLVKPFDKARLRVTLGNALERHKLSTLVETFREDFDRRSFCGFIGSSLPMQAVYRIIESAAPSRATLFITGESGTGKEVCAEAVHRLSPRKNKAFIPLNCGAIPKDLMESEIFGHIKGSFTGAVNDRDGAASLADGGTLFLDEICEMDMNLQTKLLRFIQTGTFQKVGSGTLEQVDVRFVCATNKDPLVEVKEGRFREDLYYRLHVIPLHLPPMREREHDVVDIAEHFLAAYAKEENKSFTHLAPETERVFLSYDWPGNVRELQNALRNAVVLNEGDALLPHMLPPPLDRVVPATDNPAPKGSPGLPIPDLNDTGGDPMDEILPLAEVERNAIERAIDLCDGNIPRAAHFLGVSSSTIYRKKTAWDEGRDPV